MTKPLLPSFRNSVGSLEINRCRGNLLLEFHSRIVPYLKSVVNKPTVHKISASDSDTVIHNTNSSNIDTSVCDKNVHLDSCKPFACDNQPTYFNAGIARDSIRSDRNSIDTVNRDTISKVNSTDCSDYVNNSCAHDVYSDVTCELRNSGVTRDSDHTVPIHVNSDTLIDESVTDLFNADTVIVPHATSCGGYNVLNPSVSQSVSQ